MESKKQQKPKAPQGRPLGIVPLGCSGAEPTTNNIPHTHTHTSTHTTHPTPPQNMLDRERAQAQPTPLSLQQLREANQAMRVGVAGNVVPVWQCVRDRIEAWTTCVPLDSVLVKTFKEGLKLPLTGAPRMKAHRPPPRGQAAELEAEMQKALEKGAVRLLSRAEMTRTRAWTPLFGRRKPDGRLRPITDLRHVNEQFSVPRTKVSTWSELTNILADETLQWAATIDITDAYHHMPLHRSSSRWIRAQTSLGRGYEFLAMPFGIASGSSWCARMFRPLVAQLQKLGYTCMIYADDMILLGRTKEETAHAVHQAIELLTALGVSVNFEKSQTTPSRQILYLGQLIDLARRTISLPRDKRSSLLRATQRSLRRGRTTPRELASIAGQLLDTAKGSTSLLGLARGLAATAATAAWTTRWWTRTWTPKIERTLQEVEEALKLDTPVPIPKTMTDCILTTDASGTMWGATLQVGSTRKETQGFWCGDEVNMSSNWRETKATALAAQAFLTAIPKNSTLTIKTDNTTAKAVWTKGSKHHHLNSAVRWTRTLLAREGIAVRTEYLPGAQNSRADHLSRKASEKEVYRVRPHHVRGLQKLTNHVVKLDLFAARHNAVCPKFMSWRHQPGSQGVDSLAHSWTGRPGLWANPPLSQWMRVAEKIRADRARVLCIFPEWPARPWWTPVMRLIDGPIYYLTGKIYVSPAGCILPEPRWRTCAAILDGSNPQVGR